MANDNKLVVLEYIGQGVAKLTLNNPPLNLVTPELTDQLAELLVEVEADERIRAVVVTGAGGRAFCAGSDIKAFATVLDDPVGKKLRKESQTFNALASLSKPTVAAIEGVACGGGVELAICCDIRIAADNARLALPEAGLGVFPSSGGVYRLPRLVGTAKALELMYLTEFIDAEEARRIGLVNRLTDEGQAVEVALELARKIADQPPAAIRAIKRCVLESHVRDNDANEQLAMEWCDAVYASPDCKEGIHAFIEKRPPRYAHRDAQ